MQISELFRESLRMSVKVLKERERKYANMQISELFRETLHICGIVCVFARGYLHILVSVAGHAAARPQQRAPLP